MSEKIHIDNSAEKNGLDYEEIVKSSAEKSHHKPEAHKPKHEHKDNIDQIISKIEKSAKSKKELSQPQEEAKQKDDYKNVHIGGQLRKQGLKQSLNKIQSELPRHERTFSKFIHNSKVDKVSEATGATVARPSGLLAAGTFSLISSLVVLTICRYFGYEYNFLIGVVSLGGGFILGIVFEGILRIFKRA